MLRLSKPAGVARSQRPTRGYQTNAPTTGEDKRITALKMRIRQAAYTGSSSQLLAVRNSDLFQECYEWGKRQAISTSTSNMDSQQPGARNAAAVHTICYALDAYVNFSTRYAATPLNAAAAGSNQDKTKLDQVFLQQIRKPHKEDLLAKFHATFQANDEQRQRALMSSLDPILAEKLITKGIVRHATAHAAHTASAQPPAPASGLNEAELLALLDYLSSSSGTFNMVNGAAMAKAYYGEPALQACVSVYSTMLNNAINKLCSHPWFGRRDIEVYKGIRLTTLDEPFRTAMLREAHQTHGSISFPSVLSASCDPNSSYARTKFTEGYTLECVMTMRRGFYADPFHDTQSMGEHEILGPAMQRFRVEGKSSVMVSDPNTGSEYEIDRYQLQPHD
jgi:hypothetical protein